MELDDTLEEELEEIPVDVPKLISLITSLCKSLNKATATVAKADHLNTSERKDCFINQSQTKFNFTLQVPASKAVIIRV